MEGRRISLMTILVLLCDLTEEENEIQWFFPSGDLNPPLDHSQFLGWRMGSSDETECKPKEKIKTTRIESKTEKDVDGYPQKDALVKTDCRCSPQPNNILVDLEVPHVWKTIVVADSTIHYIPLEAIPTGKSALYPFAPAEDALDPFYFDPLVLGTPRQELFNAQQKSQVHFLPQQHLQSKSEQWKHMFRKPMPLPNELSRGSIRYPVIHSHSFYKNLLPAFQPDRGKILNPNPYNKKLKTERGIWTEPRHTMFIHPKLLDLMKAMDRSILSYPSRFEYKSLDQLPVKEKPGFQAGS